MFARAARDQRCRSPHLLARRRKIRVADINTLEVSSSECSRTVRTSHPAPYITPSEWRVQLTSIDRDVDRYGRKLRIVTRDGESVGEVIFKEELAEEWTGRRSGWC